MKPLVRPRILAVIVLLSTVLLGQQKYDGIEYWRPRVPKEKKHSKPVTGSVRFDVDYKALEFRDENGGLVVRVSYDKITGLQNGPKA